MASILIIESSRSIRLTLKDRLELQLHKVCVADSISDGLRQMSQNSFECIITDNVIPNMDTIPWICITTDGSSEFAEQMLALGALDVITKPIDMPRISGAIQRAVSETLPPPKPISISAKHRAKVERMVGASPAMMHLKSTIEHVAPTPARVLIMGENGTGKELVARHIHQQSQRALNPFIEVNCAAIPSELIESELFGHEKGSFTSAVRTHTGKFEQANGGTLFLDEIGDMSLAAQAKMLRALQEGTITRIGGHSQLKVDVRIIAATNKNLYEEVIEHRFREDLYHRLAVVIIKVPPLRERREDIIPLIRHFVGQLSNEYCRPVRDIEKEALTELCNLPFTGNIRELRNICERLLILATGAQITMQDILDYATNAVI